MLAERGAVEALALRGFSSDQIRVIERLVAEGGGEVLSNANGDRAVLLMPLMTAGCFPMQLAAWSDRRRRGRRGDRRSVLMARGAPPRRSSSRATVSSSASARSSWESSTSRPTSFSGDGVGDDVAAAVSARGARCGRGADIVDIGGESTRPSKTREEVSAEVELARVLPGDPRARRPAHRPDQHRYAQSRGRSSSTRAPARRSSTTSGGFAAIPDMAERDRRAPRERASSPCTTSTGPTTATSWRMSVSVCARAWR